MIEAPVPSLMAVLESTTPSARAPVPRSTSPATCQKTFFAFAPPLSVMLLFALIRTSPVTWKIQTSLAAPASTRSVGIVTDDAQR